MKIKLKHTPYVSRTISRDLVKTKFVEVRKTKDAITLQVQKILDEDIENELDLDDKIYDLLENKEDDIEFYNADYRQLFWMAKKKIANEFNVILDLEDRISDISHKILDYLWEEDFIHYSVSDNQVKNVISNSIDSFIKGFDEADSAVYEKISNYQRRIIPGTDDYNILYQRLYEEELIKRGLI